MAQLQIDAAEWARLSKLLDEALDREPAARAAWIESLGPECEPLKAQLRDLLSRSSSVETRDFLGTLPKLGAEPLVAAPSGMAGQIIGAYRLLREIGAGGMGSVWLAERTDGLINRPVALKLPHLVVARRAELAERMAREREILATLDHRNIARLLDAGISAEGQPFLALEYVEGLPIDTYCSGEGTRAPIDLHGRLGLFRQVADAVAYAHGKLVVHRDLKPANILVTADGSVRLLDFGIAKLLEQGHARETRLTELSGRALTPDYASPEQILGEPLTVASDVYSLGVILYELLSGERPYKLKRDSRGALEDAIVQMEPNRPSEVAAPAQRRALRGDLDTIVLKALKKKPQERYGTVDAFAEDIARHLDERPVVARADSNWYRLRKFAARNRLGVSAATVVLLAILVGAGIALWQAQLARAEQARAESVKNMLTRMLDNADPGSAGGKPLSAAQLLLSAAREFENQPAQDPNVRAELANVLARSLFRLGEDVTSEQLAIHALADMQQNLPSGDPHLLQVHTLIAEQLRYRGKTPEARAQLEATRAWLPPLRESHPRQYIEWLLVSADLAIDESDFERAIRESQQALAESERHFGRVARLTASSLAKLAISYHSAERNPEALTTSRESLELTQQVFKDQPLAPDLIDARVTYAKAVGASGQFAQAAQMLAIVIRDASEVHGATSVEVGVYQQNIAGYLLRAGRIEDGIDAAARAVAIRVPQVESASFESLATRNIQARALMYGRRAREAAEVLAGMQDDASKAFGANHRRTLGLRAHYALTLAWCGELEKAVVMADDALKNSRANGAPAGVIPLRVSAQLARLARDFDKATVLATEALQRDASEFEPPDRAELLAELGYAASAAADFTRAERNFTEALEVLDRIDNSATPLRAEIELGLSRVRHAQKNSGAALSLAQRADSFWRDFDPTNRAGGETAFWLAQYQAQAGHASEAAASRNRAWQLLSGSVYPGDAQMRALRR